MNYWLRPGKLPMLFLNPLYHAGKKLRTERASRIANKDCMMANPNNGIAELIIPKSPATVSVFATR